MTTSAPTPAAMSGADRSHATICTSCGSVNRYGRQVTKGILAAVGLFLMVPLAAVLVALVIGAEAVQENSMFLAIAWLVIGIPGAGAALRKGFRRACPDCGSTSLIALDSVEGRQVQAAGPKTAVLSGHTGNVTALAALPDGRLASGAKDNSVRIWDVSGGAAPIVLTGHTDTVTALAVAPGGRLVSAAKDKTVRVWDMSRPGEPVVLSGYERPATAVAALPDGRVVTGEKKGMLRLRDPARPEGAGVSRPAGFTSGVKDIEALAVLPDSRVVASGWDETLRIWDPVSDAAPDVHRVHGSPINDLAVLRDGRLVCGASVSTRDATTGQVLVLDLDSGDSFTLSTPSPIRSLAVLPDGRLAAASYDGLVRVWTLGEGVEPPLVLKAKAQYVAALPDGRLATTGWSKAVRLWELAKGEQ